MLYRVALIEKGPDSSPVQVPQKPRETLKSRTENELTPEDIGILECNGIWVCFEDSMLD